MKLKLLPTMLLSLALSLTPCANAGLILDGKEYMDFGLTRGQSHQVIEKTIALNDRLNGFSLATAADVAHLWGLIPGMGGSKQYWRGFNGYSVTEKQTELINFFITGTSKFTPDEGSIVNTRNSGPIQYDSWHNGYLRYQGASGVQMSGRFNIMAFQGAGVAAYAYAKGDKLNLNDTNVFSRDRSTSSRDSYHSLYVRSLVSPNSSSVQRVDVSEPTSFAIFLLTMIGLASRRIKKRT